MDSIISYERNEDADFYKLLGCDELSSTEQINTEYKARVLTCHPDKCPDDKMAGQTFSSLQQAKCTLTDPVLKSQYDHWRRSGIAMSFTEWQARKDSIKTSLHWAMKAKKEPMLEAGPSCGLQARRSAAEPSANEESTPLSAWRREPAHDALKMFRNYEI